MVWFGDSGVAGTYAVFRSGSPRPALLFLTEGILTWQELGKNVTVFKIWEERVPQRKITENSGMLASEGNFGLPFQTLSL